jgi:MarR family transcriptional regulator, transcriptional regulator for hemolysin
MEIKSQNDQPPPAARFGQQLGIAVTLYRSLIERLLAPHDLTWAQFSLLVHLARRTGPTRISDIADAVELSQPAVSKVVQKFLGQGLVGLDANERDARSRLVAITGKGRAQLAEIQQGFGPVFSELLTGWSGEDLEEIISGLTRLNRRMDAMRRQDE